MNYETVLRHLKHSNNNHRVMQAEGSRRRTDDYQNSFQQ